MTTQITDIAGPVKKKKVTHTKSILQSWTKLLRKKDVTVKALTRSVVLLIRNTSFFPLPQKTTLKTGGIISAHD